LAGRAWPVTSLGNAFTVGRPLRRHGPSVTGSGRFAQPVGKPMFPPSGWLPPSAHAMVWPCRPR